MKEEEEEREEEEKKDRTDGRTGTKTKRGPERENKRKE